MLLSSCTNIAYDLSESVMAAAELIGFDTVSASTARWIPTYIGGCGVVVMFSITRITVRRTWSLFVAAGARRDAAALVVIGLLLSAGQLPYGTGTHFLGKIGVTVGWAVYISVSVIIANVLGFLKGEWSADEQKRPRVLLAGVALLISGVLLVMWGNSVTPLS